MTVPNYIKDAQNKYNSQFDIIQLKLPMGTKDRIKNIIGGGSMAAYCKQAVLTALDSDEDLLNDQPQITAYQPQTEPITGQVEQAPTEQPKEPGKAHREPTPEELAEWQRAINAKKDEQDRREEEQRKAREEKERQEREAQVAELLKIAERIRNGEPLDEDPVKAQARIDSILKNQYT